MWALVLMEKRVFYWEASCLIALATSERWYSKQVERVAAACAARPNRVIHVLHSLWQ